MATHSPFEHFLSLESANQPTVTVTPANASVQLTGSYTIMMVDADIVGADLSKGVNKHWLLNGVTISSKTQFRSLPCSFKY